MVSVASSAASQLALSGPQSGNEGSSGSPTAFQFTITRAGDLSGAVSVSYAVTGTGSSQASYGDFSLGVLPAGTVNFAPGETSKTVTINIVADASVESAETFLVTLSGATNGASITQGSITAAILNDDTGSAIRGVVVYQGSSFGSGPGDSPSHYGSTDPTDIAFNRATGHYVLVDSEVDETPFFSSTNMFDLDGRGSLATPMSLTSFTKEPTGVAAWVTPSGAQHYFITDDNEQRVFEVDAANPGVVIRSFSTRTFGCVDPEDISINPNNGNLFILSENDHRIYEVTQTGQLVSTVELPSKFMPIADPNAQDSGAEGLAYDAARDVFYIGGGFSTEIFVVSRAGLVVDTINILNQYPNANGLRVYTKGLELGPSSDGSGNLSLWVTDYGLDQVADGRVIEIMLNQPAQVAPSPTQSVNGTSGNDVLNATSDAQWIIDGLAGADRITALGGKDVITGGSGNDVIASGGGDDLIRFKGTSAGYDSIDGGSGVDRIEAGSKGTVIGLSSVSGVEVITANGFASVSISGSSAANTLDFSDVVLTGITAIKGGGGDDWIYGSQQKDVIVGGSGADTLYGNGGSDVFDFNALSESAPTAPDHIMDFAIGADKLDLKTIDANTLLTGNQAFMFIGEAAFSNKAGELRVDTSNPSQTLIVGDVNGDGLADFGIVLNGTLQLHASDLLL